MPKKPSASIRSFGIYDKWDAESKDLPQIRQFTTVVPARIDIEFGFIVNITGAKNALLDYCIEHPGIRDQNGIRRDPFDGQVYVKTNDWDFYLGDTIWLPFEDKLGDWNMWVSLDNCLLAEKTFRVVDDVGAD